MILMESYIYIKFSSKDLLSFRNLSCKYFANDLIKKKMYMIKL